MAFITIIQEYIHDKEERHAAILKEAREKLGNKKLEIEYTEKGKPEITGISEDKYMSVTTTGDYTVAVISDHPIGLDGECMTRYEGEVKTDYLALAERFFTEEEAEYVRDGDGDPVRFVRIWTRKEAFVKYTGKGLSDFSNFSVCDGERFYSKIGGVAVKKINIEMPGDAEYMFALAGGE